MKKYSQFTKIAVAVGLVLSSSTAVLGVTGFASASGGSSAPFEPASSNISPKASKSEALAKVLKLTSAELLAQIKSGKSLADIAKTQNVAITEVTAVLVADVKARLDAEVASGRLTQAQATEKLAKFSARVTDMVNRVRPTGSGEGGPMGRKYGGGRPDGAVRSA